MEGLRAYQKTKRVPHYVLDEENRETQELVMDLPEEEILMIDSDEENVGPSALGAS